MKEGFTPKQEEEINRLINQKKEYPQRKKMSEANKIISVKKKTKERLDLLKRKDETFDELLNKLINVGLEIVRNFERGVEE